MKSVLSAVTAVGLSVCCALPAGAKGMASGKAAAKLRGVHQVSVVSNDGTASGAIERHFPSVTCLKLAPKESADGRMEVRVRFEFLLTYTRPVDSGGPVTGVGTPGPGNRTGEGSDGQLQTGGARSREAPRGEGFGTVSMTLRTAKGRKLWAKGLGFGLKGGIEPAVQALLEKLNQDACGGK